MKVWEDIYEELIKTAFLYILMYWQVSQVCKW